jgi:hypothetical protein
MLIDVADMVAGPGSQVDLPDPGTATQQDVALSGSLIKNGEGSSSNEASANILAKASMFRSSDELAPAQTAPSPHSVLSPIHADSSVSTTFAKEVEQVRFLCFSAASAFIIPSNSIFFCYFFCINRLYAYSSKSNLFFVLCRSHLSFRRLRLLHHPVHQYHRCLRCLVRRRRLPAKIFTKQRVLIKAPWPHLIRI